MRYSIIFSTLFLFLVLTNMPSVMTLFGRNYYRPTINFRLGTSSINRDLNFRLGLDLQGGSHLVYQADMTKISEADRDSAIKSARNNIERRVNLLGVSESLIQTSVTGQNYRLIVELPGVKDVQKALNTIGATAQLDFRETKVATPSAAKDFISTDLTGKDLKLASVQFGNNNNISGSPSVSLEFNTEGAQKFAEITKRNIGKPLAIFLDDQLIQAPLVQTEIPDGKAVITGNYSLEEAKAIVIQLNAGALPVPIKVIEQRTVGATLGQDSVIKSLFAGVIGMVLVWLFMLVNYGFKGLLANIALLIYILLSLSLFRLIPVTLTLAGIAGFILSVGMAVDANILIFERIKEELRWGRSKPAALELGFHRAWTSVRDSNFSSLMTAGILFWFGSGPVRGFALTLIVGILVSLFTSINVTRSLLRLFIKKINL